jgi:ubiquinone/menaquinone biosynthesis C-methylase UbiE
MIFLPGVDQQVKFFLNCIDIKDKKSLIIGSGTTDIAQKMIAKGSSNVIIIVDDYDSLLTMRYQLEKQNEKNISVRMMEFDNTDFRKESFEVVFAQASVSGSDRNKIVKEIKKILKTEGIFCAGEVISLKENPPAFVQEIWNSSDLKPLKINELNKYYEERGFEIIDQKDLSFTLKGFYQESAKMLSKELGSLSKEEKSYYKKLLKKISHESNAYLKLGGNEYMGFMSLIVRKK